MLDAVNDAPVLSGTPVALPNGTEDVAYILKASDLLKGYSDVDGDTLSITSVTTASANGSITNNGDGTWTYLPTTDLNGEVSVSFVVSDGNGGTANGSTNLTLDAVDDLPPGVSVTGDDVLTDENGDTAIFSYKLNSRPLEPVTIYFKVSDVSEAQLSHSSFTFTADNWNQSRYLTVTGLSDHEVDGDQPVVLSHKVVSDDFDYGPRADGTGGVTIANKVLTNLDADDHVTLYGDKYGPANDRLTSGDGNDRLYGRYGRDILTANWGNDRLYGGYDDDVLYGGEGNDRLYGEADDDRLFGGNGNDTIDGGIGADYMSGGAGNDTYYVDDANDVIDDQGLASDVDTVVLQGAVRYTLGAGVEAATGNSSNNTLNGNAANNTLNGGAGNDTLYGASGNDTVNGGSGRDTASFSGRANRIKLNTTKWQITGDGRDRLISIENVNAGGGNDVLTGNNAANVLNGQKGSDVLNGGGGNDVLLGGGSHDRLLGGAGSDQLKGGLGNDRLVGNQGNDQLWGGAGRDTFVLSEGAGYDRIRDFRNGVDRIQFGAGVDNLRIKNHSNGHAFIYEGRDLMAIVNNAAGDLQVKGNFLV